MARPRGPLHRLARRVPGSQEAYRRLKIRRALAQKVVRVDHPALDVRIRVTSAATARLRVESVAKEPWTVAWLERTVRPGDVVWDVGANVGVYALLAARLLGEEGTVVAVEPGYANFAALCDNIVLNGLSERVVPLPLVLGESTRLGSLGYSDLRAGSALHTAGRRGRAGLPAAGARAQPRPARRRLAAAGPDASSSSTSTAARWPCSRAPGRRFAAASSARCSWRSSRSSRKASSRLSRRAGLLLVEEIHERDGVALPGVWYGIFERS